MSEETAAVAATPAAATPKKKAKSGAAKSKANPPTHPKVSEMVVKSITTLKERGGSSLQAIKKYISSEYKVDIDRLTPFIRKYLKSAVAAGTLVQTKGKGANGSFKLSASGQKTKEPKKTVKKAAPSPKKAKAPAKKTAKPKEKAEKKKKPAAKKSTGAMKKVAKPKSPKKAKATKPKAPKPKKLKTPKKAAPKKASKK
ncbi:Histone H1, orphon [Araneus ventricosus]|uniref:Histone H1, orphon n=1 Tax=Araneus ventricosus TaxID=182803 RepID=A0A4Y2UL26_ARAVE|nr:Histone H1, orphon [Araneus ventricosus]GBM08101.1 Histone H1, orphon [Araneus ventricosus]GBN27654.1 Histone H1, orphon [Araneus ventricosus]GBO13755.1 Histone H1, orphon [Araneus ventricosus]GBO29343.1 Histone H1, orphon [Araneus ventricosus]